MLRIVWALCSALLVCCVPSLAWAQTHDPRQQWYTLETQHFRIHHYTQMRPVAERVAALCEGVYDSVGALVGWFPQQTTEVLLTDNSDDANGSAISVPFNAIRLFVTAPEDLSTLNDYEDWLQTLVTHEFTHIAHMDNVTGFPALVNGILGKFFPPNGMQPAWVLEGYAVYAESTRTSGGRLRSSLWNMYLRAEVLSGHPASLDQVTNRANRWPHGDLYYLYGAHLIDYIVRRFGEGTLARIASMYGSEPVPGAVNRVAQRVLGHTWEELYPQFLAELRERFQRERRSIDSLGRVEGERLTFHSENQSYPRFFPDGNSVAYLSYDGHSHPMVRTIALQGGTPRDAGWLLSAQNLAIRADGRVAYVADTGFHRGIYAYRELYERPISQNSQGARTFEEGVALTDGERVQYLDVSPDGQTLAYSSNHHGTLTLFERVLATGQTRVLVRQQRYEQTFTPRYSPDGRFVVFSHWRRGGRRDLRLLDRTNGSIRELTNDRAIDLQPTFSPDGRFVVFSSDRTGVYNLYAHDLQTGEQWQVTNVLYGAFMPEISPDGRTIVYVGYHERGFDLYRLPWDRTRWRVAPSPPPERNSVVNAFPRVRSVLRPYNPLPTLAPRTWLASLDTDGYGPRLSVQVGGRDIVGNHSWDASVGVGLVSGAPFVDVRYSYEGLRPTLSLHAYRNTSRFQWQIGAEEPVFPVERTGGDAEISLYLPSRYQSHFLSARYEAAWTEVPGGLARFDRYLDPNENPPNRPWFGMFGALRAAWAYSRVQRYTYDVSAHEGFSTFVSARVASPVLGSQANSFDVRGSMTGFIPMPWGFERRRKHVLAVHAAAGIAFTREGPGTVFDLGGLPLWEPLEFLSAALSMAHLGGTPLRGYPEGARRGTRYALLNTEYRFHIVQIDRGIITLPVALLRLYGAVFTDVGLAFSNAIVPERHVGVGVGAEVLADFLIGYHFTYTLRTGLARGLFGNDAIWQPYAALSTPF